MQFLPPRRRTLAHMTSLGFTFLQYRNPWIAAFFAFSFPGFGYLLLERYLAAFTFIGWEVIINTKAQVNLGILYSMIGQFKQAKFALDAHWLMLYVGLYLFNIWDSYRLASDLNKQYRLAKLENCHIPNTRVSSFDIHFQDKKNPMVALIWSFLAPGTGQLYVHKIIPGFFILGSTLAIVALSNIPLGIQYSLTGEFARVVRTLDMQWAMYLPSMYFFFGYDAYVSAIESNQLFELEQAQFLKQQYQNPEFPMPIQEW